MSVLPLRLFKRKTALTAVPGGGSETNYFQLSQAGKGPVTLIDTLMLLWAIQKLKGAEADWHSLQSAQYLYTVSSVRSCVYPGTRFKYGM